MVKLTNLTRGNEIGANCYLLEVEGKQIILDAGMHPKQLGRASLPYLDKLNKKIDSIIITHSHHDHIGTLPLVQQALPKAKVFLTEPTYLLADALLHNSVNVMKKQRDETGIADYPFYMHEDVDRAVENWEIVPIQKEWSFKGHGARKDEDVTFQFHPAGHILGSVAVQINSSKHSILYTGDICFNDQTLMTKAVLPEKDIDILIIETTRGANPSDPDYTRYNESEKLVHAINETFRRGGCVLMPIFALGKTQELLTLLYKKMQLGELLVNEFFIGGLGKVFTKIYDQLADKWPRHMPEFNIFEEVKPEIVDWKKLKNMKPKRGQLYLMPSGMMTPETTSFRMALDFVRKKHNSIFFVGYADPDSPAGILKKTPRGERALLSHNEGDQPVECEVRSFDFTSHALREDILEYILRLKPKHCVLVHGDLDAIEWFAQEIPKHNPNINVVIPTPKEEIVLK